MYTILRKSPRQRWGDRAAFQKHFWTSHTRRLPHRQNSSPKLTGVTSWGLRFDSNTPHEYTARWNCITFRRTRLKKRLSFCWLDTSWSRVCPPSSPDLILSKFYVSIQIKSLIGNNKAKNLQVLSRTLGCFMKLCECWNIQGFLEMATNSRTIRAEYYNSVSWWIKFGTHTEVSLTLSTNFCQNCGKNDKITWNSKARDSVHLTAPHTRRLKWN